MHGIRNILVAGAAISALGLSLYLLSVRSGDAGAALPPSASRAMHDLQTQIASLRNDVSRLTGPRSPEPAEAGVAGNGQTATVDERLRALEKSFAGLQSAMDGVSIEKASADRAALFAAAEGYLKADEYFEAGKYAIAGEGYLTFVQHNPKHADVRGVLKKARDAFLKAGYTDKAFWVQEEMMKQFPQFQSSDLWEQSRLEKEAGLYDAAVNHALQAAELAPNPEERLWRRSYWAWYVVLRDGTAAGVDAMRQVQQEIAAGGFGENHLLAVKARERLLEWQNRPAR